MLSTKKTFQQLKSSLKEAQAENEVPLQEELQKVILALQQPWPKAFRTLTNLLQAASSHVTKHHIAKVFGYAEDPRVLKPLIQAAKAPENENYNAMYFWACAEYDCTKHLNFFVQFLIQSEDPGEAMVACVTVIEEMKGPFDSASLNRTIIKLLRRNRSTLPSELQEQDELFTIQAAYALLDKYFSQVDAHWKSTHPFHEKAAQLISNGC